jgi:hypothetical protein
MSILAYGLILGSRANVFAIVPVIPGDYNLDGLVSHADYSEWASIDGTPAGYNVYRENYGTNGPSFPLSAGPLSLLITPVPTGDGNVQWTIAFTNVSGPLAGHLSIRIDGPSAPNIVSLIPGPAFQHGFIADVPGDKTSSWQTPTNLGGSGDCNSGSPGNCPVGVQYDNSAHEAYAALGSEGPLTSTLTFATLVTAGQSPTTIRVLGSTPLNTSPSKYGYKGSAGSSSDYGFGSDVVATFVPEPSSILLVLLTMTMGHVVTGRRGRRSA